MTGVIFGLVLLVGISLGSYRYINASAKEIGTHLDRVEQMIQTGKWETAESELGNAEDSWDKTKYWWSILLNHQEIDNIDVSITRLEKYIQSQGLALSLGEISTLKMLVEHVSDTEAFTIRNIL